MLLRKYSNAELDGTNPEDMVYNDYFSVAYNPETSRGMRVRRMSKCRCAGYLTK